MNSSEYKLGESSSWSKYLYLIELISVLLHIQRYFSHISDGTDVQADWRSSCTYGRASNAIDIS